MTQFYFRFSVNLNKPKTGYDVKRKKKLGGRLIVLSQ